jgi:hypothetical protein
LDEPLQRKDEHPLELLHNVRRVSIIGMWLVATNHTITDLERKVNRS